MIDVVDRIAGDGTFRALVARIRELSSPPGDGRASPAGDGGVVSADRLGGSFAPSLAGTVAAELARPLLYVTAHLEQADEARDDLEFFGGQTPELLGAFETLPDEGAASDEIAAERLQLCARLRDLQQDGHCDATSDLRKRETARNGDNASGSREREDGAALLIVAPVQALMQAVPTPEAMEADLLTLAVNQQHEPHLAAEWLVAHGYTRLDQVESPGDFARRGEILDIYPPAELDPYRVDFFGDRIESIRRFDVSTQRSQKDFETVQIPAVSSVDALFTTITSSSSCNIV